MRTGLSLTDPPPTPPQKTPATSPGSQQCAAPHRSSVPSQCRLRLSSLAHRRRLRLSGQSLVVRTVKRPFRRVVLTAALLPCHDRMQPRARHYVTMAEWPCGRTGSWARGLGFSRAESRPEPALPNYQGRARSKSCGWLPLGSCI